MSGGFYVGAYWGGRPESSTECAARLLDCFQCLAHAHPLLSAWYRKGRTKKEAESGSPIDVELGSLEKLLETGRQRTDIGGQPMPELGFSIGLWNNNPVSVSFSAFCGADPDTPRIPNNCLVNLPALGESSRGLYGRGVAMEIILALIASWEPDWATFSSHELRELQGDWQSTRRVAGWATYVADRSVFDVQLPDGVQVEDAGQGLLVTAGPDPQHVDEELVVKVAALFPPDVR